jgi:acyl-CoA reductase-like NAD-dependent aldehyde dehydrogenase
MSRYGHYVNGNYVHNVQHYKRIFPDPLKGPTELSFSSLSFEDPSSAEILEAAIVGAFESHAQVREGFFPLSERLEFLERLYSEIHKHKENMAGLISREVSKPITLARAEVDRALSTLKITIESAPQFFKPHSEKTVSGHTAEIERVSRGPLLAITPFNFPLNLSVHKLAPAIAAGSPVILKPSDKAPLVSLYLTDLCHHARIPAGMLQLLHAEHEVTQQLVRDPRIGFVSFTGSSSVGWRLMNGSSLPYALELGGNASVFVDADADLALAAEKILNGAFSYAGQSCISVQNIYVHQQVAAAFQKEVVQRTEKFPYGAIDNPAVLCGPLVDFETQKRVENLLAEVEQAGATLLAQSQNFVGSKSERGAYFPPTLLGNIDEDSRFCTEEAFAPLVSLKSLSSLDDYIEIAKSRSHRLQCAVFSRDPELQRKLRDLDYGAILINESPTFRIDALPYGGQGLAGRGREGPVWAMEDYTQPRLWLKTH